MATTGAATPSGVETGDYGTPREIRGWYFYDWANSAFSTTVVTVFLGLHLTPLAEHAADSRGNVYPLGITVAAGSFFAYMVSLSVFLTVFVLPVVGAIADRSPRKKQLLALFAYIGAAATVGFIFTTGDRYLLGGALFLLANISFGASVVVYYSFLPQIAGPDRRDWVSSIGWAVGYLGGGLLLALNVVAVFSKDALGASDADIYRYSIASAGVWWAGFTTIPLLTLRNRPPLEGVRSSGRSVLVDGFVQLGHTLRDLKKYPLTLFFLIAYLVYNDGIQTVVTQASVYGTRELKLPATVLVPTILMIQFLAFGGALALGALAKRLGAWKTVLISLALWTVILVVGFYLPVGKAGPFIALGGLIGLVLGGSQALSRSLFSQLIPKGKEAEYFGIYEISDKGTSWLGPLLFGLAFQITHSYRVAIISLVAFFVIGFIMLAAVPIRRAIVEAGNVPPKVL